MFTCSGGWADVKLGGTPNKKASGSQTTQPTGWMAPVPKWQPSTARDWSREMKTVSKKLSFLSLSLPREGLEERRAHAKLSQMSRGLCCPEDVVLGCIPFMCSLRTRPQSDRLQGLKSSKVIFADHCWLAAFAQQAQGLCVKNPCTHPKQHAELTKLSAESYVLPSTCTLLANGIAWLAVIAANVHVRIMLNSTTRNTLDVNPSVSQSNHGHPKDYRRNQNDDTSRKVSWNKFVQYWYLQVWGNV